MNAEALRLKNAAVRYAQLGMSVFPCCPGQKVPYKGSHAELDGTSDPVEVAALWDALPGSNIGWALRFSPGVFVLDIDERNGGDVWLSQRAHGALPDTVRVQTPSRGMGGHVWLGTTPGLAGLSCKGLIDTYAEEGTRLCEDGVDLKGLQLGFVILPPSVIRGRGSYVFESGCSIMEQDIAPCPEWLEREIAGRSKPVVEYGGAQHTEPVDYRSFYLGRLFDALGDLGKQVRPGVFVVQCPNAAQHSGKPRRFAGDTTIYAPPPGMRSERGFFNCAHAHCSWVGGSL